MSALAVAVSVEHHARVGGAPGGSEGSPAGCRKRVRSAAVRQPRRSFFALGETSAWAFLAALVACSRPSPPADSERAALLDASVAAELVAPAVDAAAAPAIEAPSAAPNAPSVAPALAAPIHSSARAPSAKRPASCPMNQMLLYGMGCDPPSTPACGSVPPPKFVAHCGCDGKTYAMASAPWAYFGWCGDGGPLTGNDIPN